jgi:hypothetical protein
MIDIATILSIVSIIATVFIGGHYVIKSKCFGFEFSLHDKELDIKNESLNIEIELKEDSDGKIELETQVPK